MRAGLFILPPGDNPGQQWVPVMYEDEKRAAGLDHFRINTYPVSQTWGE
jgi:hypothetical protein